MAKANGNPWKPEPKYFLQANICKNQYESRYFQNKTKVFGEKSVVYFEKSKEIIPKIKQFYPDSKILVCIRNPSDRALSNYFYTKSNGLETRTLEEVFIKNVPQPNYDKDIVYNPFAYLSRSLYVENLKLYQDNFDTMPLIYEEFVGNQNVISEIYKFLGVDLTFSPNGIHKQVNNFPWDAIPLDVLNFLNQTFKNHNKEMESLLDRPLPW